MSTSDFNLLDEPWIPIVTNTAETRDVSIIEAITEAREIRRLAGDIPTQTFALLRLLLAATERALTQFAPQNRSEIVSQVEQFADHWESDVAPVIVQYLEQYRQRFYLFDSEAPFFQVADLHASDNKFTSLSRIIGDFPTGEPYLTMRSAANAEEISAAEAARWLVHAQAFDTAGIKTGVVGHPRMKNNRVYPEGVSWTGQLGCLYISGATLLTTLLTNIWAVNLNETSNSDAPVWERPPLRTEGLAPEKNSIDAQRPAGPVDLYTWQSRCVLLNGDRSAVTGVLITYADSFILQERQFLTRIEPMTLWRYSKPQSQKYKINIQMPAMHQPGISLWRGMGNLLGSIPGQKSGEQPAPCLISEHAGLFEGSRLLPDGIVRLAAVGVEYGSNNSVIDTVYSDDLDIPATVLNPEHEELRQVALDAVFSAREGVWALRNFAANIAKASGASGDSLEGSRENASGSGYSRLETIYRQWLTTVLQESVDTPLAAEKHWHEAAVRELRNIGRGLVDQVPEKAWRGFGQGESRVDVGLAEVYFLNSLRKVFPKAFESNQEKKKLEGGEND